MYESQEIYEGLTFGEKLKHAFNIFANKGSFYSGNSASNASDNSGSMSSRTYSGGLGNIDKYMITSIYNRIALDVAALQFKHIRVNADGAYMSDITTSGLNECLTFSANIDQTGKAFILDIVFSLLQEGCVAIVPIDTDLNPELTGGYDILSMRVGRVEEWRTKDVRVSLYNDDTGRREPVWVEKKNTAIVENPFYMVMNASNSTMKSLANKLNLLDAIDNQSGSGKLDMIIQVPYLVRGEARKKQAAQRKADIEDQLNNSKYGIAYIDAAERIIQLNRPVDNNMMAQVLFLKDLAYSQIGITQEIMNGTADENTMAAYKARVVKPIAFAIVDAMRRAFITKTARTQGQSIGCFSDPFELISPTTLAEVSDKLTRNEIVSSNEIRPKIGLSPSDDPGADELRNKNIAQPTPAPVSNKKEIDKGGPANV